MHQASAIAARMGSVGPGGGGGTTPQPQFLHMNAGMPPNNGDGGMQLLGPPQGPPYGTPGGGQMMTGPGGVPMNNPMAHVASLGATFTPNPMSNPSMCLVCGDTKSLGKNYGGWTCTGCKSFFRRCIEKQTVPRCKYGGHCEIDLFMRRKCPECRLKKCFRIGMRMDLVTRDDSKPTTTTTPSSSSTSSSTNATNNNNSASTPNSSAATTPTNGVGGKHQLNGNFSAQPQHQSSTKNITPPTVPSTPLNMQHIMNNNSGRSDSGTPNSHTQFSNTSSALLLSSSSINPSTTASGAAGVPSNNNLLMKMPFAAGTASSTPTEPNGVVMLVSTGQHSIQTTQTNKLMALSGGVDAENVKPHHHHSHHHTIHSSSSHHHHSSNSAGSPHDSSSSSLAGSHYGGTTGGVLSPSCSSSETKSPTSAGVAPSLEALLEPHQILIQKLVHYQELFDQPTADDINKLTPFSYDGHIATDQQRGFQHFVELTILSVQLIVRFAKHVPGFETLSLNDQIILLKESSIEVLQLRTARRYDIDTDSIFFSSHYAITRECYSQIGFSQCAKLLFSFCRHAALMQIDTVEYALLTALCIFSQRPGLENSKYVEECQSRYLDALTEYVKLRRGSESNALARLLMIITKLRNMGFEYSQMVYSLQMEQKELPPLIEEMWNPCNKES